MSPPEPAPGGPALVGRDRELAVVAQALGTAGGGGTAALTLRGGPGIGRTSLLEAACADAAARGFRVIAARGREADQNLPHCFAHELLERISDPHRRAGVPPALPGPLGPALAACGAAPGLLALDDLQCIDPTSLRWLHEAALSPPARWAVIGTSSSFAVSLGRVVDLAPLDAGAVRRLAAATLAGEPHRDLLARLELAGGVPLYLMALLSASNDTAPTVVARRVEAALRRAGPDAAAIAEALAVLGSAAPSAVLAEAADLDERRVATGLAALGREGVAGAGQVVGLQPPVVERALELHVRPGLRDAIRHRAATAMWSGGAGARSVAGALLATQPAGDRWIAAALERGAAEASDAGELGEAAVLYERAVTEPPPPAARARVLAQLGRVELLRGELGASAQALTAALGAAPPAEVAVRAACDLADALLAADQAAEARACLTSVASDPAIPERRRRLVQEQAELRGLGGEPDGDGGGGRTACAVLALRAARAGAGAAAVEARARRALGRPPDVDDALDAAGTSAAGLLLAAESTVPACREIERRLDAASAATSPLLRGRALSARAELYWLTGALDAALADAAEAIALSAGGAGAAAHAVRVQVLLERGEVDAAAQAIGQAPAAARADAALAAARAAAARAGGDAHTAARLAEDAGAREPGPRGAPARRELAHALAALGRRGEAAAVADAELAAARSFGAPGRLAAALRTAAEFSGAEAVTLLEEAVEAAEAGGAGLEAARALVALGSVLRRRGRRGAARDALRRGQVAASACGATAIAAAAREELAVASAPQRRCPTLRDELTAAERRVCELVAGGLSNQEVARRLSISVATVETHLVRAYRKLDIGSRAGLARLMSAAVTSAGEADREPRLDAHARDA